MAGNLNIDIVLYRKSFKLPIPMCDDYLINEKSNVHIQCHENYFEVKKTITLYVLEIDILKIALEKIWMSWGVIFEGLGIQMTPRRPAGYDFGYMYVMMVCVFFRQLVLCRVTLAMTMGTCMWWWCMCFSGN